MFFAQECVENSPFSFYELAFRITFLCLQTKTKRFVCTLHQRPTSSPFSELRFRVFNFGWTVEPKCSANKYSSKYKHLRILFTHQDIKWFIIPNVTLPKTGINMLKCYHVPTFQFLEFSKFQKVLHVVVITFEISKTTKSWKCIYMFSIRIVLFIYIYIYIYILRVYIFHIYTYIFFYIVYIGRHIINGNYN